MAKPIIRPVIRRGRLFFRVADVLFGSRSAAMCAYSAAEALRLATIDGGAR